METSPSSPSPPRTSFDSPEFQFNPSLSSPSALLSADELFSGGLILPLHLLPRNTPVSPRPPDPPVGDSESESGSGLPPLSDPSPSTLLSGATASKRWTDIFRKNPPAQEKKKKNKGDGKRGGGSSSSELININLWPFARSRSAGNNAAGRPRWTAPARKASSAPCSRSNSAGESKSQRWVASPARAAGGVHLGRASPVWQLPRTASRSRKDSTVVGNRGSKAGKGGAARSTAGASGRPKGRVLSLKVPVCIGYRSQLSCQSDGSGVDGAGGGLGGAGGGNLSGLRGLFSSKKAVY